MEVAARGEFIIHIENKIYAGEGDDQTKREWRDLLRRARGLGVKQQNVHGFFLTLDGHAPASPEFHAMSWRQIADVWDEFSTMSKAAQVGLFAAHYAQALRRMTFELTQIYEDEHQAQPNLKNEKRFLLEKLPDVLRLEAAMQGIRRKYYQFWDDIGRRVQREHPRLNHRETMQRVLMRSWD